MIANAKEFTSKPPAPPEMLAQLRSISRQTKPGRFLVTGSRGYVGQHVLRVLKAGGHSVYGFDLKHPQDESRPSFVGDVNDYRQLQMALEYFRPQVILHLAGMHGTCAHHHYAVSATNIVAAAAEKLFDGRVVFASSCEVYGNGTAVKETARLFPASIRGRAALSAEEIFSAACERGQLAGAINLRLFEVAGASVKNHTRQAVGDDCAKRFVPQVIDNLLHDEPATIRYHRTGGFIQRDFVHVEDAAEAFRQAAELLASGKADRAINLNIGGREGNSVTIDRMAGIIANAAGRPLRTRSQAARESEICCITSNNESAAQVIGYKPVRGLDYIASTAWNYAAGKFYRENQE